MRKTLSAPTAKLPFMLLRMGTSIKKKRKSWIKTQSQEILNCRKHATASTSAVFKGVFRFSVTLAGSWQWFNICCQYHASPYHHSHRWYSINKPAQTPASERNSWSEDLRVNSHSCKISPHPSPPSMTATAFPHQPQKDRNKSCSGETLVSYATSDWVTIKEGQSFLRLLLNPKCLWSTREISFLSESEK